MRKTFLLLILFIFGWQASRFLNATETEKDVTAVVPETSGTYQDPLPGTAQKTSPYETGLSQALPEAQRKEETKLKEDETSLETRRRFNKLSRGTPQIYKVSMRSNVVYQLQTALGYVSTIDLPEPALKVFVGDQELFKVGVYEREVLIKPITDYKDARTNLTVYTASGRLSFDVNVGPAETADFVLDFRLLEEDTLVENAFKKAVEEKHLLLEEEYEEKEESLNQMAKNLAEEKLKQAVAKDTTTVRFKEGKTAGKITLHLISISHIGTKCYLRFSLENQSSLPYKVSRVVVGIERYGRKTFGLRKEPLGLVELPSDVGLENSVSPNGLVYGVVVFDRKALGKQERPVFMLFEEDGNRNFILRGFPWIS